MSESRLVYMANQIATYFRSLPHDEAVASTLNHVTLFWEPRMRRQILAHLGEHHGEGLNEIALAAMQRLAEIEAAKGKLAAPA